MRRSPRAPAQASRKPGAWLRPVTLIGFTQHAHIRVEGLGIESVHAALLNTGDAIVLADLISRQGVYCGAERIRTRVLQPGDSFRLGTCLLRLDFDPDAHGTGSDASQVLHLPHAVHLKTVQGEPQEWLSDAIGAVIGSRPGCDIRLASKDVLPLHALLTRVGRQIVLASLAADKSIRVNGMPSNISIVQGGDTLTIWPITLRLTLAGPNAVLPINETRLPDLQEAARYDERIAASSMLVKGNRIADIEAADGPDDPSLASLDAVPPAPLGEIPDLGSRLLQMEEQLRDSSRQLRQWQAQLEKYANGLIRRDAELTKRSDHLDELQGALQVSEGSIQKRSEELDQAEAALQAKREDIARRESRLAGRSQAIERFEQALGEAWDQFSRKE